MSLITNKKKEKLSTKNNEKTIKCIQNFEIAIAMKLYFW